MTTPGWGKPWLLLLLLGLALLGCKQFGGAKREPPEEFVGRVKTGTSWSYVDGAGRPLWPNRYDYLHDFTDGLARARVGDKESGLWGFINSSGAMVIAARFPSVGQFSVGLAPAQDATSKLWGFVDKAGAWAIQPTFSDAKSFGDGIAPAKDAAGQWGYVNPQGAWVISPRYSAADPHNQGYAPAKTHKWGLIDRGGKFVIRDSQLDVGRFSEGRVATWDAIGGRMGTAVRVNCSYVKADGKSAALIPDLAQECKPFKNGLARAARKLDGKLVWGYMNLDGKWQIEPTFRAVRDCSADLCAVQQDKNGLWGFVDPRGNWAIKPDYENADAFGGGVAPVKQSGSWGYIDTRGKWVVQPSYTDAMPMLRRSEVGL